MTPKEKAKELVEKYDSILRAKFEKWGIAYGKGQPKRCAIIAVDEIIEVSNEVYFSDHQIKYYEDVKQEIEKL